MTKKKPRQPQEEVLHTVLTEHDRAELRGAANVLVSLLTKGTADPDDMRYVGYLMLSFADRFEAET